MHKTEHPISHKEIPGVYILKEMTITARKEYIQLLSQIQCF